VFVSLLCLITGLPFFILGFLWSEIKGSFTSGEEFGEHLAEKFGRWLNGN
jgi:hypothetical protein